MAFVLYLAVDFIVTVVKDVVLEDNLEGRKSGINSICLIGVSNASLLYTTAHDPSTKPFCYHTKSLS
jgi:hypothetical protein